MRKRGNLMKVPREKVKLMRSKASLAESVDDGCFAIQFDTSKALCELTRSFPMKVSCLFEGR